MGFAPRILPLPWRQGQLDRQRGQPACMNGCSQAVPGGTLPVPFRSGVHPSLPVRQGRLVPTGKFFLTSTALSFCPPISQVRGCYLSCLGPQHVPQCLHPVGA